MVANVRCSLERVSCGTADGKFVSFHLHLSRVSGLILLFKLMACGFHL